MMSCSDYAARLEKTEAAIAGLLAVLDDDQLAHLERPTGNLERRVALEEVGNDMAPRLAALARTRPRHRDSDVDALIATARDTAAGREHLVERPESGTERKEQRSPDEDDADEREGDSDVVLQLQFHAGKVRPTTGESLRLHTIFAGPVHIDGQVGRAREEAARSGLIDITARRRTAGRPAIIMRALTGRLDANRSR